MVLPTPYQSENGKTRVLNLFCWNVINNCLLTGIEGDDVRTTIAGHGGVCCG